MGGERREPLTARTPWGDGQVGALRWEDMGAAEEGGVQDKGSGTPSRGSKSETVDRESPAQEAGHHDRKLAPFVVPISAC